MNNLNSILDYLKVFNNINKRPAYEPRTMAQEPRNMFNGGGLTMDSVRVIQDKQNFRDAWKNYKRSTRGSRPLSPGQFFKIWSTENMATGGSAGQLVRNTVDGSRPGYDGKNVMSGSPAQQVENVRRQQVRFDAIAKLFKDKDWTGLKTKTRPERITAGTQIDTGGKLTSHDTTLLRETIEGGTLKEKNALAKKLGITREKMIEGYKKSKTKIATELSESMSKQMLKKVEFQKKLYNAISNNPGTIKELAKRLAVEEKYLVQQSSKLLKNVYTQNVAIAKGPEFDLDARGKKTLKSWLPDDFKSTDKFLDNFANIEGLKKVQTENMGILIRNAYKNNPKKYTEALQVLGDYNKFVNSLPKGMKVDLDHPLSKAFLRGSGVSPDKFLHITPVDRKFNRGFKMQMGKKYNAALNLTDPILKKEAIKNIRTLADKTGVNIGEVIGKKIDYGTAHLLDKKKNMQMEYFKNLKEQNLVAQNLKDLKKTKEGKKIIKDVFERGKVEVKTISDTKFQKAFNKTFQDLSPRSMAQLAKEFGCGKLNKGGSIMSCLKTKFNKAPEKFLQRAVPLAKDNVNLFKWFKNGRKIARGTGIALAWEAAFAPIVATWSGLEGESGARIINDIAYGIPFIGETVKEEWKRESGGDELAYKMKKMGELEEQELPDLQYQLEQAQAKSAGTKEKVPGYTSYHEKEILEDIKEKKLELQGYYNAPELYEGPAGKYLDEPAAMGAFNLAEATTAKIAADKAERKKQRWESFKPGSSQFQMAEGGLANLMKKYYD